MLGCEPNNQGHGRPLTEPANNNSVRGDTIFDLLFDELIHLIPGLEDPRFVFWTFELKIKDIKPIDTNLVAETRSRLEQRTILASAPLHWQCMAQLVYYESGERLNNFTDLDYLRVGEGPSNVL